jgi:outer membrane receptor protein involved in Fe transport
MNPTRLSLFLMICFACAGLSSSAQQDTSAKTKRHILGEAVVRGSRISEKQKQSPLTVESLDIIGIRETPSVTFYEGLGSLKGVDLVSASLGFKVINTRGFNSTSPVRSLQLIDGVDNQSPGLNFSLGNFLGASELDVQKVELVVGASSAFFGPNAFNGVITMNTRSPFSAPGLEVQIKAGERELFDGSLRWAQVFKDKEGNERLGYKLNVSYMRALDWTADNLAATPQSLNQPGNPGGYDAVNVYGDEYIYGSDYSENAGSFPGLGVFYRTGYHEKEVVDYHTNNLKTNAAVHYRLKDKTELIFSSSFATGNTIYRGDNPIVLRDVLFFQNRLEARKEGKWFLRAYATNEDAGNTYDAYTTALRIQNEAKPDQYWKPDYENYWTVHYSQNYIKSLPGFPQPEAPSGPKYVEWVNSINSNLAQLYPDSLVAWHNNAQAYANGTGSIVSGSLPRFEPGTYEFDTAFAGVTSRSISSGSGSRFIDHSALYHVQGEYRFTPRFCAVTVGGNFRLYAPRSEGTIFYDTAGTRIRNSEFGFYAGAEKWLMQERLKLDVTARLDKNQNFPFLVSPAASLVYLPGKDQVLRFSFSSAIRNPTLQDQYLHLNVSRAMLAGNIDGYKNLVTIPSLMAAFNSYMNFDTLVYFDIAPVRPEQVKTLELGYRATLLQRLYLDASAYYSFYKYFIGYKLGVAVDTYTVLGAKGIDINQVYRVATNSVDEVSTMGASIGLNYYIGRYLSVYGNYSWNKLDRHGSTDPLIPAFNTPEHKFNIGFNGRGYKDWGFALNYKWVAGFTFEGSPQFTGSIVSYGLLDVQINKYVKHVHTTFKVGASNVLNNEHYEVYGGPLVGRLLYVSALYSLNGK